MPAKTHKSRDEDDAKQLLTIVDRFRAFLLGGSYSDGDKVEFDVLRGQLRYLDKPTQIKAGKIRAACEELQEEGLLKILPKVGMVFCRPEADLVRRYMGERVALEAYVASRLLKFNDFDDRMAKIKVHHDDLSALASRGKASPEEYRKIDFDFHAEFFRQAGHNRGIELLEKLRKWTASTVVRSFKQEHLAAVVSEHQKIIDAIEQAARISSSEDDRQQPELAVAGMLNRISIEWAFREHLKKSVQRAFPVDPEPDPVAFRNLLEKNSPEFMKKLQARFPKS